MSSPHDHDDELTPEQEAEAQAFAEQLEMVTGVEITDSGGTLTLGGSKVELTPEQAIEFRDAAFDVALAKLYDEAPDEPVPASWQQRVASTTMFLGFSALALAAAYAGVRGLLGT